MTKSAVRLAREALTIGRAALPSFSSRFSRHDFTQPQLFALLLLRQFLRTDYRGVVAWLAEWGELRRAQRAVVARARRAGLLDRAPVAAVDATGLETRHVSLYYRVRRGMARTPAHRRRSWPKLTAVVHTRSHLILGAVTGTGPTQDSPEFTPALRQAAVLLRFDTVLGDAGYDAEHNHRLGREELGIRDTVIALNPRNGGRRWPTTPYRRAMRHRFPHALISLHLCCRLTSRAPMQSCQARSSTVHELRSGEGWPAAPELARESIPLWSVSRGSNCGRQTLVLLSIWRAGAWWVPGQREGADGGGGFAEHAAGRRDGALVLAVAE